MGLALLDAEAALRYLRERALVSGVARVRVRDISRRNHNLIVEIDGRPAWFIKQIQVRVPEVVASLEREARCCQHAHSGMAPGLLRDLMPRCASYDPLNSVLVMECLDGVDAGNTQSLEGISETVVAREIGQTLAVLHNTSAPILRGPLGRLLPRSLPWVLRPAAAGWSGSRMSRWIELFESDTGVAGGLAELRESWHYSSFIHGDARLENFILKPNGGDSLALKLVDWELADIGDPLWDCANVMQHYWTIWAKADHPDAPEWESLRAAVQEFWHAYIAARAVAPEEEQALFRRAVQFTGARLIQSTYEQMASLGTCTPFIQRLALLARSLLLYPDQALGEASGPLAECKSIQSPKSESQSIIDLVPTPGSPAETPGNSPARQCWGSGDNGSESRSDSTRDGRLRPQLVVRSRTIGDLQGEIYRELFCGLTRREAPEPIAAFAMALSCANLQFAATSRKESVTDQPGAYIAFGRVPLPKNRLLRVYWNVAPRGAIPLMAHLSLALNLRLIPFQLKVLLDTSVQRRDAAVLYVPADAWLKVSPLLKPIIQILNGSGDLLRETPLFTKEIFPGVAIAEDPPNGMSFGTHRSGVIARAIEAAHRAGDGEQQWSCIVAEFEREGLAIERPYLNPGSRDVYDC